MTNIDSTAFTLGLLCMGCENHAVVMGFRSSSEARSFARFEMGWMVDDGIVFCPFCQPDKTYPVPEVQGMETNELAKRVQKTIVAGKDVECTAEEWPEVRRLLQDYAQRAFDDERFVYGNLAQEQEERLTEIYG